MLTLRVQAIKAQDEAKPVLGSNLVASAAQHCQMLGLHRESTYQRDDTGNADGKRRLFWTIYMMDHTASLFLGRASYIPDFDIDCRYPPLSENLAVRPWDSAFIFIVKLSEIQAEIYNQLYSAQGLRKGQAERIRCINDLELALRECNRGRKEVSRNSFPCANFIFAYHSPRRQITPDHVENKELFYMCDRIWDLSFYSTLTTMLRASFTARIGGEIETRCLEAARLSLNSHLRCFSDYQQSSRFSVADYANWFVIPSTVPFTISIVTY